MLTPSILSPNRQPVKDAAGRRRPAFLIGRFDFLSSFRRKPESIARDSNGPGRLGASRSDRVNAESVKPHPAPGTRLNAVSVGPDFDGSVAKAPGASKRLRTLFDIRRHRQ